MRYLAKKPSLLARAAAGLGGLAVLLACATAHAQGAGANSSARLASDTASSGEPAGAEGAKSDRGAFVAGGKVGGLASFNGLGPNVTGALELGYVFPWLRRGLGLLVDVGYAAPVASGEEPDARVEGSTYRWEIVQKQLTISPSLVYRYTGVGKVVPYGGVGPRIFLLETVTDSGGASPRILETKETSTRVGLGVHAGADLLVGPGALLGELLFQWAPLDHRATGDTSLAGLTLWLGYRFLI